jgi:hypothetical protein
MVRAVWRVWGSTPRRSHHPPLPGRFGSPVESPAPVLAVPPPPREDPPFKGVGGDKFGGFRPLHPTPWHACAWGGYSDLVGRTGSVGDLTSGNARSTISSDRGCPP